MRYFVLLLLLLVATLCEGFQSSSCQLKRSTAIAGRQSRRPQNMPFCALYMSEDDEASSEVEIEEEKVEPTVVSQTKEVVLCPDCDLCDGSGRYVVEL